MPAAAAFLWDARLVVPGLHLRLCDELIDGIGAGRVALGSAIELDALADTPELNAAALHRYLAEAVWVPSALLPVETPALRLGWTVIDAHRALATIATQRARVELEFRFAPMGDVDSVYTPTRGCRAGKGFQALPRESRFGPAVRTVAGLRVQSSGEVGWYDREGDSWQPV